MLYLRCFVISSITMVLFFLTSCSSNESRRTPPQIYKKSPQIKKSSQYRKPAQMSPQERQVFLRQLDRSVMKKSDLPKYDRSMVFGGCDTVASHPDDTQKPKHIAGIPDHQINLEKAIDFCIAALEKDKNNARINFQLGRALFLAQFYDEAEIYLKQAKNTGYNAANYYLAIMQLHGLGHINEDPNNALEMFQLAANNGFEPAIVIMKENRAESTVIKRPPYTKIVNEADEEYSLARLINWLMTGEIYDQSEYSIAMLYLSEMLNEYDRTCTGVIAPEDMRSIRNSVKVTPSSRGYKQHIEQSQINFKTAFSVPTRYDQYNRKPKSDPLGSLMNKFFKKAHQEGHPNNAYKEEIQSYQAPIDMLKIIDQYGCGGEQTFEFIGRAIEYIETAPPYNYVSEIPWNSCINNIPSNIPLKTQFCGCFLGIARGDKFQHLLYSGNAEMGMMELLKEAAGGTNISRPRLLSHNSGNELINDFWNTAQWMMDKNTQLAACKKETRQSDKPISYKELLRGKRLY